MFAWMLLSCCLISCRTPIIPEAQIEKAFEGKSAACVIIDCTSGSISNFRPREAVLPLPPCSTFKIWNALMGVDSNLIQSVDEPFYQWDGAERAIPEWNRNLTFHDAFQVSCVPAFQALARKIGEERMRFWVDSLGYGDRDISAGLDVFWLPAKNRKTILITPMEQAALMVRLVNGNVPFSKESLAIVKEIMLIKKTDKGALFGKTGSGLNEAGIYSLGWFVGYVESGEKTFAFASCIQGENVMGKDVRAIIEKLFESQGYL